jgi:hypothetical protein
MLNRLRSAISSFIRAREAETLAKRLDVILGKRPDPNEVKRMASVQRRLHAEVMSALADRRSSWSA